MSQRQRQRERQESDMANRDGEKQRYEKNSDNEV